MRNSLALVLTSHRLVAGGCARAARARGCRQAAPFFRRPTPQALTRTRIFFLIFIIYMACRCLCRALCRTLCR